MTTLKGVIRSYSAAERTQQKHNRETAKRYKLQQKAQDIQNAVRAEADYRSYINVLKSVHKDHSEPINWSDILNEEKPIRPEKETRNEEKAQRQIDHYKPSFFDKLFGLTSKKIEKLNRALHKAKDHDESDFNRKLRSFKDELADYDKLQAMARGVLNKDENAYKETLEYFAPFDDLTEASKQLKFKLNPNYIDVEMELMSYSIIPGFELSLTSTGKLSRKNMSTSKYNELLQEHICSSVIRIAKEITIYFPVNYVSITVVVDELDGATGHRINNVKLSTLIPSNRMGDIVLKAINPVDCVKSFVHNMKFVKTTGFSNVAKIDIENNLLSI